MTNAATLLALAGQVEKLTGPCRETDALIWCAVEGFQFKSADAKEIFIHRPIDGMWIGNVVRWKTVPNFTGSLDPAMTLRLDWMSIELTESAANDSTSDPRFTRCRIWDWRRGPLAIDRTNEWKAEGNRPLPLNIVWAILHARAAQASSVPAGERESHG